MTSEDVSDGEGLAAATGRCRIGVANDELRPLQILFVVDLRAHQVLNAHRVDYQCDTLVNDLAITVFDTFVKSEAILETGTAATRNEHPELQVRIGFLFDQFRLMREFLFLPAHLFDAGFNPDRDPGDDEWVLHLSIGMPF